MEAARLAYVHAAAAAAVRAAYVHAIGNSDMAQQATQVAGGGARQR